MMQRSVSNPTMTSVVRLCFDTDLSMPCNIGISDAPDMSSRASNPACRPLRRLTLISLEFANDSLLGASIPACPYDSAEAEARQ